MICHRGQTADHRRRDMPVPLLSAPLVAGHFPAGPKKRLDAAFIRRLSACQEKHSLIVYLRQGACVLP